MKKYTLEKIYALDGRAMQTRESAYGHIAAVINFPDYFGRNLDALYDLLTEYGGSVTLKNAGAMLNALGGYGCQLLKAFFDAANECERFSFRVK
ncbi:MAG: barstar family protein [Clostridia bacterium]|nr:barstar family protein [Clostridia bacterium]